MRIKIKVFEKGVPSAVFCRTLARYMDRYPQKELDEEDLLTLRAGLPLKKSLGTWYGDALAKLCQDGLITDPVEYAQVVKAVLGQDWGSDL